MSEDRTETATSEDKIPADNTAETPKPTEEVSVEAPAEVSPEAPAEAPAEVAAEAPAEVAAEAPAEDAVEAPAEVAAKAPAEVAADAPAKADEPAKPKAKPKHKDPTIFRMFRARRPVKGKILKVIKGGYEVQVGRATAFCPHSQLALKRIDDSESEIGKTYDFRIAQLRRAGEDIVLSRRMLLEAELEDQASSVRASLVEGVIVQGKVRGLSNFGAFVDLGAGVTGLVHLTELGWGRYTTPSEAVKVGDPAQVKILRIRDDGKISLGIKQALDDPWKDVESRYAVGSTVEGKLLRFADFGAFVELESGVEGLAPAREMAPKAGGWREGLEEGAGLTVRITAIEPKRHRISLLPVVEGMDRFQEPLEAGQTRPAIVQKVESFGIFLWLGAGHVGMMPNVLSGEPRGADMNDKFPVGGEVEVEIVDIEEGGKRIRLAKPGQAARQVEIDEKRKAQQEERRAVREVTKVTEAETGTFGSSLGDVLKAALNKKQG